MSKKEEGIHQVPGKQGGSVRKSKQSTYRRVEISERTVLSTENGLRSVFDCKKCGEGLNYQGNLVGGGV